VRCIAEDEDTLNLHICRPSLHPPCSLTCTQSPGTHGRHSLQYECQRPVTQPACAWASIATSLPMACAHTMPLHMPSKWGLWPETACLAFRLLFPACRVHRLPYIPLLNHSANAHLRDVIESINDGAQGGSLTPIQTSTAARAHVKKGHAKRGSNPVCPDQKPPLSIRAAPALPLSHSTFCSLSCRIPCRNTTAPSLHCTLGLGLRHAVVVSGVRHVQPWQSWHGRAQLGCYKGAGFADVL
jgi:hypothetical protein